MVENLSPECADSIVADAQVAVGTEGTEQQVLAATLASPGVVTPEDKILAIGALEKSDELTLTTANALRRQVVIAASRAAFAHRDIRLRPLREQRGWRATYASNSTE